jgi:nucleotide-binding universal stress UspA family protein
LLLQFKEAAAMLQKAFAPLVTQAATPTDAHLIVAPQDPSSIVSILLNKQRELAAAAFVVGPHAKGPLTEWWLGSVTKGLLRHSPVPVIVVPPPKQQ